MDRDMNISECSEYDPSGAKVLNPTYPMIRATNEGIAAIQGELKPWYLCPLARETRLDFNPDFLPSRLQPPTSSLQPYV